MVFGLGLEPMARADVFPGESSKKQKGRDNTELESGSYYPSSDTDNSVMRAPRANGIPWGIKLTILGGLMKERKPRSK